MRYLLIDSQNMFHRAIYVTKGSADLKARMAIHISLTSIAQSWKAFGADHLVYALECRTADNWRRIYYDKYKANRQHIRESRTEKEKEEADVAYSYLDDYLSFVNESTNASILHCPTAEADDLIAHWIAMHPDDEHIIISSDRDFNHLVAKNVIQYNGVSNTVFRTDESFVDSSMYLKDWKEEIIPDTEYILFEKCIRGDTGDNIFTAYPRVRKDKIRKAFDDRNNRGFEWNNFMMQRWTDHEGNDNLVRDLYERNKELIDLRAQPDTVKEIMTECIVDCVNTKIKDKVGFKFMQFCSRLELNQALDRAEEYAEIFNAQYPESKLTEHLLSQ